MKHFVYAVSVTLIVYTIGAFVAASPNIGDWDGFGKMILAGLWLAGLALVFFDHRRQQSIDDYNEFQRLKRENKHLKAVAPAEGKVVPIRSGKK